MENKTYSYKKFNHMLKMNNEPNKMDPYTDKQFEEDLKKWFSETKAIHNNKLDELDKFIESLKQEKV
jgi:hypothetical protein